MLSEKDFWTSLELPEGYKKVYIENPIIYTASMVNIKCKYVPAKRGNYCTIKSENYSHEVRLLNMWKENVNHVYEFEMIINFSVEEHVGFVLKRSVPDGFTTEKLCWNGYCGGSIPGLKSTMEELHKKFNC